MDTIPDGIYSYKDGDREILFRFNRGAVRVEEVVVTRTPIFNGQVDDFTEIDGKPIADVVKSGGRDLAIKLEDGSLMYCRFYTKVR